MDFLANQHSITIHFPIAFIIFYIFLEVINLFVKNKNLQTATNTILFLGVVGGIAAVLTGNLAFQDLLKNPNLTEVHKLAINSHEQFASITMWYFLFILILKIYVTLKKKNESLLQYIFVIFSLIGFYFIYKTAKAGGVLVYKYGIGTRLLE